MSGLPMNRIDRDLNATWWQVYTSQHDYRDITWDDLLGIARLHWNWVSVQRHAYTDNTGSCLVAALMMPCTSGAVIFLFTIARGTRRDEMAQHGAAAAHAWHGAVGSGAYNFGHAESAAEYLFETSGHASGIVSGGRYHVEDRDNPNSRMKLAVWGRKPNYAPQGEPVELCAQCMNAAIRLNIDYWTPAKNDIADRHDGDSFGHRRRDMPPPRVPGPNYNTTPYGGYPVVPPPPKPKDDKPSSSASPGGSSRSRAPPSTYARAPASGKPSSKSKSSHSSSAASEAQLLQRMKGLHIGSSSSSSSSSKKKVSPRY